VKLDLDDPSMMEMCTGAIGMRSHPGANSVAIPWHWGVHRIHSSPEGTRTT